MRELLVYDHELEDVGMLSTLATGFFSAASGCLFFVIGLITTALMQDKLGDKAIATLQLGIPVGIILMLAFTSAGIWAKKNRSSRVETMKQQAIDIEQDNAPLGALGPVATAIPSPTLDTATSQQTPMK